MAETLGAGGDGDEGTGRQSTRSHRQAGAPSRDLSNAPHLDGELRRERSESSAAAVMVTQLPELEREEKERGKCADWPGRSDRATWSGSTRWDGANRWARSDRWGLESF
jgi:hypothetical protein